MLPGIFLVFIHHLKLMRRQFWPDGGQMRQEYSSHHAVGDQPPSHNLSYQPKLDPSEAIYQQTRPRISPRTKSAIFRKRRFPNPSICRACRRQRFHLQPRLECRTLGNRQLANRQRQRHPRTPNTRAHGHCCEVPAPNCIAQPLNYDHSFRSSFTSHAYGPSRHTGKPFNLW